jgi:hypothetical protein
MLTRFGSPENSTYNLRRGRYLLGPPCSEGFVARFGGLGCFGEASRKRWPTQPSKNYSAFPRQQFLCPSQFWGFACLGVTRLLYIWRKPHYEHVMVANRLSDLGPHRYPKRRCERSKFTSMTDLFLGAADYGYSAFGGKSPPKDLKIGGVQFRLSPV